MSKTDIVVTGAGGRMGRAVIAAGLANAAVCVAGAIEAPDAPILGVDIGILGGREALGKGVQATFQGLMPESVIIDFTVPHATLAMLEHAQKAGCSAVIGTTGFSIENDRMVEQAARTIAIVKSGNMSLGINLLAGLVRKAAAELDQTFDIEIFDSHHRHKVDAPSGTALMLAEAAAHGRNVALNDVAAYDRRGPRSPGAIGFSVMRGGGTIGDHDVSFANEAEVLTLSHRALDRGLFAQGAVAAAIWVSAQKPGLYSMEDVLGL